MAHQYIRLTDEQVNEFHRQIGLNQAALLQGMEETAHKGVFFFVQFMEKPFQLQIGILFDVAQEGGGIKLVERPPLQSKNGFGGFAQAALPCKQIFKFGTDAVFLFGNDFLQERVFTAVIFVKGNAADGGLGADSAHGYGGKTVFAEQAAGGVGDGLLFAGGHDGRKVLILFIKEVH
ncbi:hypothetical protein NEISICOT_00489 [Neisseria sicca ATCC 29256]|uniref:Uncharacterized protein n=1 Tax=Neisseria sicca ATCC 29256 TaxID=547045 RepID=C6M1V1_NEISI|nr:hypothetical protein NEISICOT_00489 [Neisseria sicca ATCC 29256]